MSNVKSSIEKLRNIFEVTIDIGEKIQLNDINEIDYYSILCKSIALNKMYKIFNCNVCSFNCDYENEDSIVMVFSIPISTQSQDKDRKHPSEKAMDIIKVIEECFIDIDFMSFKEVKEDKFSYLTIIKKLKEENDE